MASIRRAFAALGRELRKQRYSVLLFKNAFQLMVDNFKLNYKLLLYKALVAVITVALGAALLYAPLRGLFISAPMDNLLALFRDFFSAVTSGNTEFLSTFAEQLQGCITALLAHLQENVPNIVLFFTGLIVVTLVSRFLDGIGNYTFGCLIDSRLSSYASEPFAVTCIANLGRSTLWQVIYVPVTFVYDLLALALCYLLFLVLLSVIQISFLASVAALLFSVALLLAAQAVKLTLFNDVIPCLVTEKMRLRDALKAAFRFSRQKFGTLFSTYLVTAVLILCVNVLFGLASFGAALLITIPMSYLMLICIQFVSYYHFGKKKYFLSEDVIILPKERTQENFYDDFEI